jgi:hypothetical protein
MRPRTKRTQTRLDFGSTPRVGVGQHEGRAHATGAKVREEERSQREHRMSRPVHISKAHIFVHGRHIQSMKSADLDPPLAFEESSRGSQLLELDEIRHIGRLGRYWYAY